MARLSAEEMFKNMIGRKDDCDMSELVRQALDQFFA